ncbi:MAG: NBR1-Ig-like domain-containing protein [Anaerolineaceae bacterium]|jgi:hypothetical protein|nr:NBR1-Ig-like domain-containing protein [Anaerolineaceae bacterium]
MDTIKPTRNRVFSLAALFLVVVLVISACAIPTQPSGDPIEQAMQTLQAQATQDYYATSIAQLETLQATQSGTIVPNPTNMNQIPTESQPTVVVTVPPSTAVPPTAVPPTATPIPPTPTPRPCLQITYISDLSIPDGTKLNAGTAFTKIWRLQNSGSCNWDSGFDIVFTKGNQLGANAVYDIPYAVPSGQYVDISINMVAPSVNGKYSSEWMLKSSNGVVFGTGSDSKGPFWVRMESINGQGVVYNFAESVCSAKWTNGLRKTLSCPGNEKDVENGYALAKANPVREDGGIENEIGLITRPNEEADGYIQGIYPAFTVKDGDKFRTTVQCQGGSTGCDIKFELYYTIEGQKATGLGQWHEVYDNNWKYVEVDLSSLAGKQVVFTLVVWNEGSAQNNRGLWLYPIIYRTK